MKHFNYRPFVVVAALILAWQLALGGGNLASDTLAPPWPVIVAIGRMVADGSVFQASGETLLAALLGLMWGGALGTSIGLISGMASLVASAIRGPVEVLRPLPAIAIVP